MANNIPENIPEEYRPISMWGYFGYQLLFSIPCVGFILLIIFAVGGTSNINVRNFARSYFCYLIILAILFVLLLVATGGLAVLTGMSGSR
ncbi:MAG: hypothetical protein J1E65_09785 [Lachnospiraceae bacterium]|nr:hypothetical protein [Lachnospiraceae bacterium]